MITHIIWDISPSIFPGFDLLRWYSVCWVIGIIMGYSIMLSIYKREGIPPIELDKLTTYLMLGAIIGARLGHVLFYDPVHYLEHPIEILPIRIEPTFQFTGLAGLASHGGVLAALLALYFYDRKFKRGYLWHLDRIAIAGAALGGFIRLGNLINSEIIGTPTDLPWAFIFVKVDQIPRHPAQLYEALCYFLVSLLLYAVWKSRKCYNNNGFIFGLGIVLIFTQRFLIEFIKENQVSFEEGLTLNMGQTLSIPLVLVGVLTMIWSIKNSKTGDKIN